MLRAFALASAKIDRILNFAKFSAKKLQKKNEREQYRQREKSKRPLYQKTMKIFLDVRPYHYLCGNFLEE